MLDDLLDAAHDAGWKVTPAYTEHIGHELAAYIASTRSDA